MTSSWRAFQAARQREWAYKLARAAALTALLVGLAPAESEAAPMLIDCTTGPCVATFTPDDAVAEYFFGYYAFRIGFDQVLNTDGFTLGVTTTFLTGPQTVGDLPGFRCVENSFDSKCIRFTVTGGSELVLGSDYAYGAGLHAINLGVTYGIFGFPEPGDPVDLGETDNFSSFMVYFNNTSYEFALAHFDGDFVSSSSIADGHCGGSSITACAETKNFQFTVPEPASILLLGSGLAGLAFLKRRRDGRS